MCGLFGTIRPHHYPRNLRTMVAAALIGLGYLAEERGVDSTGIAALHSRTLTPLPSGDPAVREHTLGRWRIRTTIVSTHLPSHRQLRSNLTTASVVLGLPGARTLDNASHCGPGAHRHNDDPQRSCITGRGRAVRFAKSGHG